MAEFGALLYIIALFLAFNLSIGNDTYPLDWLYKAFNVLAVIFGYLFTFGEKGWCGFACLLFVGLGIAVRVYSLKK